MKYILIFSKYLFITLSVFTVGMFSYSWFTDGFSMQTFLLYSKLFCIFFMMAIIAYVSIEKYDGFFSTDKRSK
ncbi:hypothetical protein BG910_11535 [Neisseria chenwenguii]|uniref:Uncharacterized protein n=1 Tax=Neisseria chenwenguii TaxID=1853278 RepID=A0A220S429_9NEIS|nr:hypothetical protein BG910_11535 [Neisseria chenwenguii]